MKNTAPVTTAIAASLAFAATASLAATWTGANGADLSDPANWSGDVYSTEMQFSGDASLTLGSDANVFRVFGSSGANRNITIDLSGHDLGTTAEENSANTADGLGRDFWRAPGTTIMVTNSSATSATLTQKSNLTIDRADFTGQHLIVSGQKTAMNGSIDNRAGAGCRLDVLDGATLSGVFFDLAKNYLTNNVANGATLSASEHICVGNHRSGKPHDAFSGPLHGNYMSVSDATLSASRLFVACGQLISNGGAPYDNIFRADGGATVTLTTDVNIGCGAAATNNAAVVSGSGTTLSTPELRVGNRQYYSGFDDRVTATMPATNNVFIAEDGATVSARYIYVGAGGNSLVVRSGADVAVSGILELSADMTAETIANAGGRIGSRVEVVGGTLGLTNRVDIFGYGFPHEVFVGEGGWIGEGSVCFRGSGARLVVSNGTAKLKYLYMRTNGSEGTNNTVRIMGARADVQMTQPIFTDAEATLEFVIPREGWSLAPFKSSGSITLPADFTLRLDAASVKAYRAYLNAQGLARGTVPLMKTNSWRGITVDDAAALSANLPECCKLVNESGVLSVEIKANAPTVLSIR